MSVKSAVLGRNASAQYSELEFQPDSAAEGPPIQAVEPEAEPRQAREWPRSAAGGGRLRRALLSGAIALCLFAGGCALRASLRRPLPPPAAPAALPMEKAKANPGPAATGNVSKKLEPAGDTPKTPRQACGATSTRRTPPPMRLLINSHAMYKKPLDVLLQSMARSAFDCWEDVMIVFGGSEAEMGPHTSCVGGHNLVVVNTTLNAYDYTALWAVWRYRLDPLVQADKYYYLLDSSSVGPRFTDLFKKWSMRNLEWEGVVLVRPKGYHSNLCIFTHSLLYSFQGTYRHNFTKAQAVRLEIAKKYSAHGAMPLLSWARLTGKKILWTPVRRPAGVSDIYGTGFPRVVDWYPRFHVYHYMLAGRFGDITKGEPETIVIARKTVPR